ncbi:MAG: recombination protein RecA [Hyphomonadaceae bacterium]|nr:MAG: recombination protein RecA [Hyphomonadaceae bacterium]
MHHSVLKYGIVTEGNFKMSQQTLRLVEKNEMDKEKALESALAQIERAFGKGSIMRMGANQPVVEIEAISTGSLSLDMALGIGGLPRGRIVEIYGPESSGKTTLALHCVAEAQKNGGVCAFVDAEHALDPVYARKLGVDLSDLLISQPDTGEQALEIVDTLVRSGAVDVLVIDSVAALTPKAEIEGDMGASLPGLQARLMSQALRKLTASIARSNTLVIFINQIRMKIGVMFGSPETTTGGNALGELVDLGVKAGIVEKSGSWYSYDSQRIGQGRDNARQFLKSNPDLANAIEEKLRNNSSLVAEVLTGDVADFQDDE